MLATAFLSREGFFYLYKIVCLATSISGDDTVETNALIIFGGFLMIMQTWSEQKITR